MREVICLAVGQTYELVMSTKITAHPDVAPYPRDKFEYLIPIKKGGVLEYLYEVKGQISCLPSDVYKYKDLLSNKEYAALIKYHELRKDSFGYGKKDTNYTFYILGKSFLIEQPFEKKGIQVAVRMNLSDVPVSVGRHIEDITPSLEDGIHETELPERSIILKKINDILAVNGDFYARNDNTHTQEIIISKVGTQSHEAEIYRNGRRNAITINTTKYYQVIERLLNRKPIYHEKFDMKYVFELSCQELFDCVKVAFSYDGDYELHSSFTPNVNENVIESNIKSKTIYVGITDTDWFNFVKKEYNNGVLNEYLNFWTPGKKEFKALEPGELFLFKLHNNAQGNEKGEIVGGAFFCGYEKMDLSDAWDRFGNGNGTESLQDMRDRLFEYRERNSISASIDIGCIILRDPFFLTEWIDEPSDWKKSIVSGKKYDTICGIGKELLEAISATRDIQINKTGIVKKIEAEVEKLGIQGEERRAYIKVRVNQSVFRERLLQKYSSCCLCKVEHTALLRASHIKPWSESSSEEKLDVYNGLLLCPNHDALFDGGFISFDDNGKILISERLTELDKVFMNVNLNMKIELTERNKIYLDYHRKNIFK